MLRHLVVNADDLGLTAGVNDGIFDAHHLGILTSASVMANAPATDDAIRRARSHESLGIGVHLTLVDGVPLLPPRHVPSLVTGDGRFRHSWKPFIAACLQGRVSLAEVERELAAQIDFVRQSRIHPTHLDAHKHVHAYPPIFAIVVRLAVRFGIPVVRVPYERASLHGLARSTQAWLNAAMWPWARLNRRTAASLGVRTPHLIGRVQTGTLDAPSLHTLLRQSAAGVTELMVHPGYPDEALRRTGTRLLASRLEEVALLCRADVRGLLRAERINLVRHDLIHLAPRSLRYVS